jgi:acetyl-CoA acetyltransferase
MQWQRYMHQYGATREHLATFVVNSRRNANLNPRAFFYNTPMSRDDYLASRWIAEPLCLFDCDIPVEGCVAIVLTTAERAEDLQVAVPGQARLDPTVLADAEAVQGGGDGAIGQVGTARAHARLERLEREVVEARRRERGEARLPIGKPLGQLDDAAVDADDPERRGMARAG